MSTYGSYSSEEILDVAVETYGAYSAEVETDVDTSDADVAFLGAAASYVPGTIARDEVLEGTVGVTRAYPDVDGRWRALVKATMGPVEVVSTITHGSEDRPAWQVWRDPDLCPPEFLPWLAQHVGVSLPPDVPVAEQRERIKDPFGFGEATTRALEAAAAMTLTGQRAVRVFKFVDGYWSRMTVVTRTSETPNPTATLAALTAQKPAGVKLTHTVTNFALIGDVEAEYAAVGDVETEFSTVGDLENWSP